MVLVVAGFGDGAGAVIPARATTMAIMAVDLMAGDTAVTEAVLMAAAAVDTAGIKCLPKVGDRRIQPISRKIRASK